MQRIHTAKDSSPPVLTSFGSWDIKKQGGKEAAVLYYKRGLTNATVATVPRVIGELLLLSFLTYFKVYILSTS